MTTFLLTLLDAAQDWRQSIRRSGNESAHEIETLLDISARHVSVVRLGADLFAAARSNPDFAANTLGSDQASLEMAVDVLALASGMASLDLCASALMLWQGRSPSDGRGAFDLGDLQAAVTEDPPSLVLSRDEKAWYTSATGAAEAGMLKSLRDQILHHYVRKDVTLRLSDADEPAKLMISKPGTQQPMDLPRLLPRIATFTEKRWRQFWPALIGAT